MGHLVVEIDPLLVFNRVPGTVFWRDRLEDITKLKQFLKLTAFTGVYIRNCSK